MSQSNDFFIMYNPLCETWATFNVKHAILMNFSLLYQAKNQHITFHIWVGDILWTHLTILWSLINLKWPSGQPTVDISICSLSHNVDFPACVKHCL